MTTLFISDLHLSQEHPAITELFLTFLQQCAPRAERLYILGDLFEAWLGDDASDELSQTVRTALQQCQQHDTTVAIMHGNRDFLIGPHFAKQSASQLISDPSIIELNGERVLISHGDELCTDDKDYQAFRRQVRDPAFQQTFLALTLKQRQQQVQQYRQQSQAATRLKAQDIMDVNTAAVTQLMAKHQVNCLIHGHTHRPAMHRLGKNQQRIVLGDWGENGSVLIHDRNGLQLHSFDAGTLAALADSIEKY